MKGEETQIYNAAIYVRVSKDDAGISKSFSKTESDSIANQKSLIIEFLKDKQDIRLVDIFVDDGYSGSDFNRPGFIDMLEKIYMGKINCVIVKDLSRLGRNYIETGRYVERVFPILGVRFLSVNDSYDSVNRTDNDYLMIPFHNLVNDSYLRDTSVKIRSHLEVKRKQGDYTGNFVSYGYKKRDDNHNKIEIDEYAAMIVKEIFDRKIQGMNQQKIADYLNDHGILSPMEYKMSKGIRINTNFKISSKAMWSPVAVSRILTNPIYIGILEQGKTTTPNYKIKKRRPKPKEEWICRKENHPPIISKDIFDAVARIMDNDTRTAPFSEYLHTFSGLVKCGQCEENMIRKITTANGRIYAYYICASRKYDKKCSNTGISEKKLLKIVINAINKQVRTIIDAERLCTFKNKDMDKETATKLNKRIGELNNERIFIEHIKYMLYEDLHEDIINQEEYELLSDNYNRKIEQIRNTINLYEKEVYQIENGMDEKSKFINNFIKDGYIKKLERKTVVMLVKKIIVYDKETIEIVFHFADEIEKVCSGWQDVVDE